jgi:hypothetical protein
VFIVAWYSASCTTAAVLLLSVSVYRVALTPCSWMLLPSLPDPFTPISRTNDGSCTIRVARTHKVFSDMDAEIQPCSLGPESQEIGGQSMCRWCLAGRPAYPCRACSCGGN